MRASKMRRPTNHRDQNFAIFSRHTGVDKIDSGEVPELSCDNLYLLVLVTPQIAAD
jgi:hypothetical protein